MWMQPCASRDATRLLLLLPLLPLDDGGRKSSDVTGARWPIGQWGGGHDAAGVNHKVWRWQQLGGAEHAC